MLLYLIGLVIVGLIVGLLARLVVPGPDPIGIGMTIVIGIAGSFIAGIIVRALHGTSGVGFILSIACAAGLVYAGRRSRAGQLRGPVARGGLRPPRRRYW
ncbi:MAG: hypothetical protein QOF77_1579 [Solirubrobacteraceae bacterium]|jgi:uncharacterized membrane protein YeaQ/YmgE (transglycosylase-associated protein family)|nr:hypothetical protein [Solirubrobacteraceae bacterium]